MEDLSGRVLEGKYRLVRLLGRGGMGAVYEAEHTIITRRMAVKLLHPELAHDAETVERFVREARAASAIGHENIVDVQDVGRTPDGSVFLVMERLEGRSFSAVLSRRGRLPPGQAVAVLLEILAGLEAAHAKGIVHRDLKPDNVFLHHDPRRGPRVKILDFGISKMRGRGEGEPGLTRTGAVVGTAYYMAPEQARGDRDVDERVDLWAAGAVLYQALAGRRPFEGDSFGALVAKILTETPPPLREVAPDVPEELAAVVHRALSSDREARPHDAAEMIRELASFAGTVPAELAEPEDAFAATVATPAPGGGDPSTAETLASREAAVEADSRSPERTAAGGTPGPRDVGASGTSAAAPAEPGWKRATWWGIAGLLAVLGVLDSLLGLSGRYGWAPAALSATVVGGGTLVAAAFVERFWRRGVVNRWLQGSGFILFPLLGLLLILYQNATLRAQLDSHLASIHAYATVTEAQAEGMSDLVSGSLAGFLNVLMADHVAVWVLTILVLLGFLFLRPRGAPPPDARSRWWILGAGLAFLAVVEVALLHQLEFIGPLRWVEYALWALTAVALLRVREPEVHGLLVGWRTLGAGIVVTVAFSGVHKTLGYILALESFGGGALSRLPPGGREQLFAGSLNPELIRAAVVEWAILTVLFAGLGVACRRVLPLSALGPGAWKRALAPVGVAIVTAVPLPLLFLAMAQAEALWLPAKVAGMQPAAPEAGGPAAFYIDRRPQSLTEGAVGLCDALTGIGPFDCSVERLRGELAGREACPEAVDAALAEGDDAAPARCVTAVEARLYCEALGKRLPTPEEWDAAVGSVVARGEDAGATSGRVERGSLSEWTMRVVHGTPTFEVRGAAEDAPASLAPDRFSPRVGFRCAWSAGE